ncbi:MAG TPA: AAA family ATPase [Desulfuromonas sp.]|nr:AAA family ATPase [Desulfuromonas sp.]
MATVRKTRSPVYVKLSERRIRQIEELVAGWNYETRHFVLRRLRQYRPQRSLFGRLLALLRRVTRPGERNFQLLRNPELLSDWRRRFEVAGSPSAEAAWHRILAKELDWHDYQYLSHLLARETTDVYVPPSFRDIFHKLYRAHILMEYTEDPAVPRAPLVLVVGRSGSGKSATVKQAIEEVIFLSEVRPVVDLEVKRDEIMAEQPFWRSLAEVDPELAVRLERRRKAELLRFWSRVPLLKYLYRERISQALSSLVEEGVWVDYDMITPNDYQTAWSGEPGNYLRKAMGEPRRTCIRHLEEAHSAFGRADQTDGAKGQQMTLIDATNVILDEIALGRRDCLVIATTDQPEQFDPAIYRRFVERGLVIDVDELWERPENLREVVRLELARNNVIVGTGALGEDELDAAVARLYPIFRERSLRVTPSYTRRLIDSVITLRGSFRAAWLDDLFLVRDALQAVARNAHGALYNRVVGQLDRQVHWEDYIGGIKNEFSEMANNALFYNVNEEKGVVLTGPPGSGKTFLVRAWLGDNREVRDLAVGVSVLAESSRPLEGMVENLERVYDIAKLLSPAMVFFDEGDAVAPRRSPQGGSPYDKVTNKFLSIIDGESPLSRVFTVLTTNRLDILDPALIRSKRLKVVAVTGHLRDEDAVRIIRKSLNGTPREEGLSFEEMVRAAHSLCETPADFTAFAEKVRALRSTEIEVLGKLSDAVRGDAETQARFVRFNYKTLLGLLEGSGGDPLLAAQARHGEEEMQQVLGHIAGRLEQIRAAGIYPLTRWHLYAARQQLAASPTRKGKQQLDEFLETELSQEPQIGFVVGVGANDVTGVLLPIASALVYHVFPEKIVVTGAVSSTAAGAGELDLAVQMTRQSAGEALTLVQTYLQSLAPGLNVSRLFGEYLEGYSLHHQLLSTSYSVGGPSAGFALAINTLSVLLCLPVLNDFGITGAPWIKGARRGEVGASVIIGGHLKKAEKVLQYLPRMYMPQQNYQDIETEVLEAYRLEGRDIRGVRSFSALVPEVFAFGAGHQAALDTLLRLRRKHNLHQPEGNGDSEEMRELERCERELREEAETEICRRIEVVRRHVEEGGAAFLNHEQLFIPAATS